MGISRIFESPAIHFLNLAAGPAIWKARPSSASDPASCRLALQTALKVPLEARSGASSVQQL